MRLTPLTRALLGLLALPLLYSGLRNTPLARRLFMPGRRVAVGRQQLHVVTAGTHHPGPTVVLEAGLGGTVPFWNEVFPEVACFARVLAYDRAGYGWSTARSGPFTPMALVSDLKDVLDAAGAPPPYLLVGHSFGGMVVRLFAQRHPTLVAGLVLADASGRWHPRGTTDLPESFMARMLHRWKVPHWLAQLSLLNVDLNEPLSRLPRSTRLAVLDLLLRPVPLRTYFAELATVQSGIGQADHPGSLGNLPLVVIRQGEHLPPEAPEVLQEAEDMMQDVQLGLMRLSSHARMVVAEKSGHQIILDQPGVVVKAIKDLHQQASQAGLTPPF